MVRVIDSYTPGSSKIPPLELDVYLNPQDGATPLGFLAGYGVIRPDERHATWTFAPFGVPVREAFERLLDLARQFGVETIWVKDPDGLFPAEDRSDLLLAR